MLCVSAQCIELMVHLLANTYGYLLITQIDHQRQLQKLKDDMSDKDAEYERNLKAAKEDGEKSIKWSRISTC